MIPQFKRILVSKRKVVSDRKDWEQKTFEEELQERVFTLVDCGEECNESIKTLIGGEVILSDTRGVKVKEEDDVEWFILPQETILADL